MAFRVDNAGQLIAFAGSEPTESRSTAGKRGYWPRRRAQIAWAPVPEMRCVPGGAVAHVMVRGTGSVRIWRVRYALPSRRFSWKGRCREAAAPRLQHGWRMTCW